MNHNLFCLSRRRYLKSPHVIHRIGYSLSQYKDSEFRMRILLRILMLDATWFGSITSMREFSNTLHLYFHFQIWLNRRSRLMLNIETNFGPTSEGAVDCGVETPNPCIDYVVNYLEIIKSQAITEKHTSITAICCLFT